MNVPMIWHGFPGHLIVSDDCRYHLCTEVGQYLVSTVGAWKPRLAPEAAAAMAGILDENGWGEVGYGRKFETFVFRLEPDVRCDCDMDCGMPKVAEWGELDSLAANTPAEAQANHMTLLMKYAALAEQEATP